jgi:hypothetical protein
MNTSENTVLRTIIRKRVPTWPSQFFKAGKAVVFPRNANISGTDVDWFKFMLQWIHFVPSRGTHFGTKMEEEEHLPGQEKSQKRKKEHNAINKSYTHLKSHEGFKFTFWPWNSGATIEIACLQDANFKQSKLTWLNF